MSRFRSIVLAFLLLCCALGGTLLIGSHVADAALLWLFKHVIIPLVLLDCAFVAGMYYGRKLLILNYPYLNSNPNRRTETCKPNEEPTLQA